MFSPGKVRFSLAVAALMLLTLAVYRPVGGHRFVDYDDPSYVTKNVHVQGGLTPEGVRWALTATHAANWHPLTWLSHMLDVELFGLDPGRHHQVSLLLHALNAMILFLVLRAMTGALWRSAAAAALFALHPLHVESVAWVAERKDVLSTLFWMLAMAAYGWYVRRPGAARYLAVAVLFTLGLTAKPMLVTFPFVLLLLDFWPLGRWRAGGAAAGAGPRGAPPSRWRGLLWEKAPLFVLTAASCVITYYAQRGGGAVKSIAMLPLGVRLGNALVSYVGYIGKALWPAGLAVAYPHAGGGLPLWPAALSGLVLAAVTALVLRQATRYSYLSTGWLWYLGTLVPVIGVIQVGEQAMADRYTYLPLIGLFVMAVWGVYDLLCRWRFHRRALVLLSLVLFSVFPAMAGRQVAVWEDNFSLFRHAIDVTSGNYMAHHGLGRALAGEGKTDEAIAHYNRAIAYNPLYDYAYVSLGAILIIEDNIDEAIRHLLKSLQVNPGSATANFNLGICYSRKGKTDDAIRYYREAIRIYPEFADAHNNLGSALYRRGLLDEARESFSRAVEINPFDVNARYNLGLVYLDLQRTDMAVAQFRETLRLSPGHKGARAYLEAISHQQQAPPLPK
jgi:Flp pilus assembly protein TadD